MIQKICEALYPNATYVNAIDFTKYFEGGLTQGPTSLNVHNPYNTWSNSMGDVIKWAFNLTDLDGEIPWNLMINETND
jgi:hypothetical protein